MFDALHQWFRKGGFAPRDFDNDIWREAAETTARVNIQLGELSR
jgi:hypothetical protein